MRYFYLLVAKAILNDEDYIRIKKLIKHKKIYKEYKNFIIRLIIYCQNKRNLTAIQINSINKIWELFNNG